MSNELKPEIQKTIKRLSTQKNYEVLKNKIRSWITTREMNVTDFIRACRDKSVYVPPPVINKIGMLFSSGKEGLQEDSDTAFLFYLTAGDLGFASANGNVAQYYFDGRAPGGRNLDLAYQYCRKAIELGADKFMLMSEILHERQDYPETIRYLRKIIESKPAVSGSGGSMVFDYKKRIEARKLEIQCLYQSLQRVFVKLQRYHNNSGLLMMATSVGLSNGIPTTPSTAAANMASTSMDLGIITSPLKPLQSPMPGAPQSASRGNSGMMSPGGYANSPMMRQVLSPMMSNQNTPNPRSGMVSGGGMNTPGQRGSIGMSMGGMNVPSPPSQSSFGNSYQQSQIMLMSTMASTSSRLMNMGAGGNSLPNNTPSGAGGGTAQGFYEQQVYQHHLPGWFFITEDLEGFDVNACGELTARAEVIALEAEAIKSAFETAESHVSYAKKHKFSEQIISVLMNDKVAEFQRIFETLESNKTMLLDSWEKYIDTKEHIFRRQIMTEKRFFNPQRMTNVYIFQLAKELYHRRLYDYLEDYLDCDWNTYYRPNEYLNEPLVLTNLSPINYRIPSMRSIIVAERSLLETAITTYGRHTGYQHCQKTGWTGDCNNLLQHYAMKFHTIVSNNNEGEATTSNKEKEKERSNDDNKFSSSSMSIKNRHHDYDEDDEDDRAPITITPAYQTNKSEKNQLKEQLLKEHTYLESVVIGTAVIRYKHHTHPMLMDKVIPKGDQSPSSSSNLLDNHNNNKSSGGGSKKKHGKKSGSGNNATNNTNNAAHKDSVEIELRGSHYYTMDDLGDSDDIWHFLNRLTMIHDDEHFSENEKKLADLILRFTREGRPILLSELQVINEDVTEGDCNHLMKVIYHYFVKRLIPYVLSSPASSSSSNTEGYDNHHHSHHHHHHHHHGTGSGSGGGDHYNEIPLASGQARALLLLRLGHVSIKELFDHHSSYGIFYFRCKDTMLQLPHQQQQQRQQQQQEQDMNNQEESSDLIGLNALERLKVQLGNINALYQKAVLETSSHNFAPCIQFWKKHRHGVTIPTYRTLQNELKEVYGGDHDSDDEDGMNGGNHMGFGINYERDVYGADDRELDHLLSKLKI